MKTTLLLTAAAVISSASFANASEAKSAFGGFYVGVDAGMAKQKPTRNTTINGATINSTASTKTGFVFGVNTGYGHAFNNFYVGVELGLLQDTSKTTYSINGQPTYSGKFSQGMSLSINPHFGYIFGSNLVYIKTAIENTKYTITESFLGKISSSYKRAPMFVPGFGYKYSFGKAFLKAEYSYVPGVKVINALGTINDSIKAKSHRVLIGAGYQF